ncbi:MAG TPA: hypothetical protein VME19_08290 [Streptosporangiaceae bacterium]|nr:hypothetical protein [Streptosporangiaceae bacterium]
MLASATVTAAVGHPAVAALLGLGACGLAASVVAMAWNVHVRQIRLAELLARRQINVADEAPARTSAEEAPPAAVNGGGNGHAVVPEARGAARARPSALTIDGPDTVVAGEQVRYSVRPSGNGKVVTWAAGGGSVSQAPDPAHPDQLLLIADRPGNLTITARVREGLTERRETKSVTAVPDAAEPPSPAVPRLFVHTWGLVVVAVVIVGFAGALAALGSLASSDFIALVAPLGALLAVLVLAMARTGDDAGRRPGHGAD